MTSDFTFDCAIQKVLSNEGGYVNDSSDPGGETKYGISKRSYPDLNIQSLTLDNAKAIYYQDFWLKNNFDEIDDPQLSYKILDLSINMGAPRVIKFLQNLVKTKEDGIMGKITLAAINKADSKTLYNGLIQKANDYYLHLIKLHPTLGKFKNGWMNRLHK